MHGDLAGMFDGPTTKGLDLSAPLVVLDLSALYTSAALGVLMACATAWLQAALARTAGSGPRTPNSVAGGRFFLVVDEAWAILSNLGVARWLQSSWKLSRAFGVSNVAVLHRVSDLRSVGASDSEQVALAQGLLSDSETRVVYAQSPGELEAASELLSLSDTEADLLPQLRRGIALWKVGQRSFLVQHRLSALERQIVDTDAAMTARNAAAMTGLTAEVVPVAVGAALWAGISYGDVLRWAPGQRRGATAARRGARWSRRRDLRALTVRADDVPRGRLLLGVVPTRCLRARLGPRRRASRPSRASRSSWSAPPRAARRHRSRCPRSSTGPDRCSRPA